MTIREAIRQMVIDVASKKMIRIGKATNIDADKCICDVDLGNGASLHAVKLKAIEEGEDKGLVIIPKQDTMVCAAMLEGIEANWSLIQYSEIESWQITTSGGAQITVADDGKVYLNGQDHGGLVKIEALVDRLKEIEDTHDKLVDMFDTHVHTVSSGTAIKLSAPSMTKMPSKTNKDDLENKNVQHGDGA